MTPPETNALFGDNTLKLGIFGPNCDHGCSMTLVDDAFHLTWDATKKIAVTADRAGFEALVPVARWKGIGDNEFNGRNFETYTWAAGLAEATERITLVTTSHVQSTHPVVAAKAVATIDHISGGRSCLNVVNGWFQPEFSMFGGEFLDHDERYAYATEWYEIVQQLWTTPGEFDYKGRFFTLEGGYSLPKPVRSPHPPLMNAGGSEAGRKFIADNCDIGYMLLTNHDDLEIGRRQIEEQKERAAAKGRDVRLWTTAYVVQRDTKEEAERYLQYFAAEHGDDSAGETAARFLGLSSEIMPKDAWNSFLVHLKAGYGGFPLVGTADDIAERLAALSEIGLDGVALSWVDYLDGLDRFTTDVLPKLEQAGLRKPYAGHLG
ncbi:LLM class flavin-dependent oxidoreductase [Pseudonocardia kujensis]|uniref:LLM class flavin-dependent oxidoreductase n=1 Tax=Pseudonocardia kujensis TaxID=1128675 RepID=UPI001E39E534|nr:LLM class flavin-dependent oxidoreductase [Pseudonocardia kujensis]MCE0761441.1 LLM class flavin-dependent oxidoreductase [Pseudonocardia kujensis]